MCNIYYVKFQFQDELGGPTNTAEVMVTVALVCTDGKWTYTENGVTSEITEISCPLEVTSSPCTSCTPNQITFTPMSNANTMTPFYRGPTLDGNGCLQMTLVCPPKVNGKSVFMQFNINGGGPLKVGEVEVTAVVNCIDNEWVYVQNGVSRVIYEVNCLVT